MLWSACGDNAGHWGSGCVAHHAKGFSKLSHAGVSRSHRRKDDRDDHQTDRHACKQPLGVTSEHSGRLVCTTCDAESREALLSRSRLLICRRSILPSTRARLRALTC